MNQIVNHRGRENAPQHPENQGGGGGMPPMQRGAGGGGGGGAMTVRTLTELTTRWRDCHMPWGWRV